MRKNTIVVITIMISKYLHSILCLALWSHYTYNIIYNGGHFFSSTILRIYGNKICLNFLLLEHGRFTEKSSHYKSFNFFFYNIQLIFFVNDVKHFRFINNTRITIILYGTKTKMFLLNGHGVLVGRHTLTI